VAVIGVGWQVVFFMLIEIADFPLVELILLPLLCNDAVYRLGHHCFPFVTFGQRHRRLSHPTQDRPHVRGLLAQ